MVDIMETLTGRFTRYGQHVKVPSSQPGHPSYRVTLKQVMGPADFEPVLECECESYKHRKACRHQRIAAMTTLIASACPNCGGRLNHAGRTVGGLDIIACNKCEFAVDFSTR